MQYLSDLCMDRLYVVQQQNKREVVQVLARAAICIKTFLYLIYLKVVENVIKLLLSVRNLSRFKITKSFLMSNLDAVIFRPRTAKSVTSVTSGSNII